MSISIIVLQSLEMKNGTRLVNRQLAGMMYSSEDELLTPFAVDIIITIEVNWTEFHNYRQSESPLTFTSS